MNWRIYDGKTNLKKHNTKTGKALSNPAEVKSNSKKWFGGKKTPPNISRP